MSLMKMSKKSCSSLRTTSLTKCISSLSIRDDESPFGFHNLSSTILLKIFSHLSENELRKSVIPVCHKWRLVASLPDLWHQIKFVGPKIPQEFICKQLRLLKYLRKLCLIHVNDVNPTIRQISRCLLNLTHVTIKYCKSDESHNLLSEKVLRNLVLSCRNLKEINLRGIQFYGNTFYLDVAALPHIKSVNFTDNKYFSTKNLFQLVLNCDKLEELKVSHRNMKYNLCDDEAIFLFSHLNHLKSLSFDMIGLTSASLQNLLMQCRQLEKLSLLNNINISQGTIAQIKTLINLQHLKIAHSQLDAESCKILFSMDSLRNLISLNLTGSWKLTTDGLKFISECCINLEKIILKSCRNLTSIEPLLNNCKNITLLNVAFCEKLRNSLLQNIPAVLGNLKSLYLDKGRCDIAEQLKQNYPDLNVYTCHSEYNKRMTTLLSKTN